LHADSAPNTARDHTGNITLGTTVTVHRTHADALNSGAKIDSQVALFEEDVKSHAEIEAAAPLDLNHITLSASDLTPLTRWLTRRPDRDWKKSESDTPVLELHALRVRSWA